MGMACVSDHVHVRLSVSEFEKNRLPACQSSLCPACGAVPSNFVERYRTTRLLRGNGTDTFDASTMGEHDPHLHVACGNCGFWWTREVDHA
jgi:hypothetical protein